MDTPVWWDWTYFFWQRHLIPYVSRCRGQIDIFKWCSFISKIPDNLSIICMRLSFNKVSFPTQFIISDVYPNVWKSFRFKVSPTWNLSYICAMYHLTGNTFTKKQYLFAFTNEVNIMHLSLESPATPNPGKHGAWVGLCGGFDSLPFSREWGIMHFSGRGELVHFGLCVAWWGWGLEYFSLLPCPSREE